MINIFHALAFLFFNYSWVLYLILNIFLLKRWEILKSNRSTSQKYASITFTGDLEQYTLLILHNTYKIDLQLTILSA